MKALCKYYPGNTRLLAGIKSVQASLGTRMICIEGIVSQSRSATKISTSFASFLGIPRKQGSVAVSEPCLCTSNPIYSKQNDKLVDIVLPEIGNVYQSMLAVLRERYRTTESPFELTFGGEKANIVIMPTRMEDESISLTASVAGVPGEVLLLNNEGINDIVRQCTTIKSFRYDIVTSACDKSVIVRRGYSEILREIARYINKTLCFIGFSDDNESLVEQYISVSAVGEIVRQSDGKSYFRRLTFPFPFVKSPCGFLVMGNSVDDILLSFKQR